MKLTAKRVFNYLLREFSRPQATISEVIVWAHEALFEEVLSELQAHELSIDLEEGVRREISRYFEQCRADGVSPKFKYGVNPEIIINKQAEIHDTKVEFLSWLSDLDPIVFESFCKRILELEGCENVCVTQPSCDGGVDFYGTKQLTVGDDEDPTILKDVDVLVIGQAKRYNNRDISVEDLRNFIGAFHMIRNAEYVGSPGFLPNPIPSNSFKPHTPTLLIYVTSGKATNRAIELSRWLGVKLVDSDRIVDLLNSKGVGMKRLENKVVFDKEDLRLI